MIAQEVAFVPVIHRGFQKQPAHPHMSHLLEASVRSVDATADNAEAFALHLLAEQIILRESDLLVESAKLAELFKFEEHKHSCGKRVVQPRQVLKEIVARVEQPIDPASALA